MRLSCVCMKGQIKKHSCEEELRAVELKVTPARIGVLTALEKTSKPVDIASLLQYLQSHHIKADKATVFRIMNSLTEKGLAVPIQLNEGKFRYEHAGRANHHHFICESCGTIEDIADCNIEVVENSLKIKKGLLVKRHSLEFFGLCKKCQQ